MVVCTVANCSNSSRIKQMRFFKFPNEEARRNLWLKNAGLEKEPGPFAKLCEVHFSEDQFEANRADGWKRLRLNAVPSIFPQDPEEDEEISATPKTKRRRKRKSRCLSSSDSEDEEMNIVIESVFSVAQEDGAASTSEIGEDVKSVEIVKSSPKTRNQHSRKTPKKTRRSSGRKNKRHSSGIPVDAKMVDIIDVDDILKKYIPDAKALPALSEDQLLAQEEKKILNEKLDALENSMQELKQKHRTELDKIHLQHQKKVEAFKDEKEKQKETVQKQLSEMKASIEQLNSEKEALTKKAEQAVEERREMEQENEAMLQEVEEFVKNNRIMSKVIVELEKHNSQLSSRLSEVEKSLKEGTALNHVYKRQLGVYMSKEQIDRLKRVRGLREE